MMLAVPNTSVLGQINLEGKVRYDDACNILILLLPVWLLGRTHVTEII